MATQTLTVTEARPQIGRLVEHVAHHPDDTIILTQHGKPRSALIGHDTWRRLYTTAVPEPIEAYAEACRAWDEPSSHAARRRISDGLSKYTPTPVNSALSLSLQQAALILALLERLPADVLAELDELRRDHTTINTRRTPKEPQ